MITVRPIAAGEGALLHAMIRSLADSHGQLDHLEATPRMLEAALAEPHGVVGCLIAEADGAPAGYAFWHRSFSTFRGRSTIYLKDIAVLPDFQRHGIGPRPDAGHGGAGRARGLCRHFLDDDGLE